MTLTQLNATKENRVNTDSVAGRCHIRGKKTA